MLNRIVRGVKERAWRALEPALYRAFHKRLYHRHQYMNVRWMGAPVQKIPSDLWVYQEILFETRPQVLIETGTYDGGSALFFAHMFDILGEGEVLSIDISPQANLPQHPRITYLTASSTAVEALEIAQAKSQDKRTMVILDSDHRAPHVREELKHYPALVSPGCYLIVEDTNINGHPVSREFGPGPMEALDDWLKTAPPFEADSSREKFLVTFHPRGFWVAR